jgi:hypothetical protein
MTVSVRGTVRVVIVKSDDFYSFGECLDLYY